MTWRGRDTDALGRGRHQPHKYPFKRTLIGTTDRWLPSTVRSTRSEPMTSGNAPAADCSRCRGRRASILLIACSPADERSQRPCPESAFPQVKVGLSGQGRGRTADLPLFRGSITPETIISESIQKPSSPALSLVSRSYSHHSDRAAKYRIVPFRLWASCGEPRPAADLWGNCGPRGSTRPGAGRSRIHLPDG